MSSGIKEARRLVEHRGNHWVISAYVDLDPERFATPRARSSEIRSLIDQAQKDLESDDALGHQERVALREDLERIDRFLSSPSAPFQGARSLAVFCASRDDLFETIQLPRPVPAQVVIERSPYVEPMIAAVERRRWLVALVNRRSARLLVGSPHRLRERIRVQDNVPGRHDQGGWSQANYERSIEKDVADHLRHVAEIVNRRWREERFDRLALGGPSEVVPRFEELLDQQPRANQAQGRADVDISNATEADVTAAVERLVEDEEKRAERDALDRLGAGIGAGGRAAGGPHDTVEALNERRVATLLIESAFDQRAQRCSNCGLLLVDADGACPVDGGELDEVEHLREAVVELALLQDADVMVVRSYPDLGPHRGIGALLRF